MKKIIAVLLAVSSMTAMAETLNYLYWMVGDDSGYGGTWNTAAIRKSGTDSYLTLVEGDAPYELGEEATYAQATYGVYAKGVALGSDYLVDLFWDGTKVAYSSVFTAVAGSDSVTSNPMAPAVSAVSVDNFTATGAVPEPTSGLLSLFGLALLAIRRKKVA